MKVVILLCVVVLALADDVVERPYGAGYRDIDHGHHGAPWSPRPYPYPKPPYYYRPGRFHYSYDINYPKYWARQGKQETIDRSGTRGSYYVNEPNSNIHVQYDYPRGYYH